METTIARSVLSSNVGYGLLFITLKKYDLNIIQGGKEGV